MASDSENAFDTTSRPDSAYMMAGMKSRDHDGNAPFALPSSSRGHEANPLFEKYGEYTHTRSSIELAKFSCRLKVSAL